MKNRNMRKFLLLFVACCSTVVMAQQVKVTRQQQLLKGVESGAYYPVLSPDGNRVLFTGNNSKGLKVYDIEDNVVTTITDADRAGFNPRITSAGKVYYVKQNAEGAVKYRTAVCYDIDNKTSETLIENARNINIPEVLSEGGVMLRSSKGIKAVGKSVKGKDVSVYTEGSKVVVCKGGKETSYSPVESYAGYLWESLSPDKTKVAFYAAGKGVVIMDLNGKVLAQLGKYEMPCWLGNDYIVCQDAKDDGHQMTASHIVLLKADGSYKQNLTSVTSMTMQPTTASEMNRIVYSTIDGNLFLMDIEIND